MQISDLNLKINDIGPKLESITREISSHREYLLTLENQMKNFSSKKLSNESKTRQEIQQQFQSFSNEQYDRLKQRSQSVDVKYKNATTYFDSLNKNKTSLGNKLKENKDKLTKLNNTDQRLNLSSQELNLRWQNIESPWGKLPIGFTDLIAIFPLAISIGFLVCSFLLYKLLRLFRIISYTINENDDFFDIYVYLHMPIFTESITRIRNMIIPFLTLSAPAILFIISTSMIIHTWNMSNNENNFLVYSSIYSSAYYLIYAISGEFFFLGYWLIVVEVRHIHKKDKLELF